MTNPQPLKGKVALVAGATRGAGRGIASMLGEAGATVYCTGRSSRGTAKNMPPEDGSPFDLSKRTETIEETAEMVDKYGGKGIAVRVDHSHEEEVRALVERIESEQGRLDILVNDIWGGDSLTEWDKRFWEMDLSKGFLMIERAVFTHIITSRYAVPLLVKQKSGLVVEITDGETDYYRRSLFYDFVKNAVIRLAYVMSVELRPHNVAAVAVTPGFLRSEAMLEHFGVTEANWRDGAKVEPDFISSETPYFVGRAIAALAADPKVMEKTGKAFSSWGLSDEYHFSDIDGSTPHWGNYFAKKYPSGHSA